VCVCVCVLTRSKGILICI